MAVLELVTAPDPRLQKRSLPVEEVNDEIRKLMDDMMQTMYLEHGIGLSAVQVGVLKRVIVADVTQQRDERGQLTKGQQYFMANPEILELSFEQKPYEEGCLSFPGEAVNIKRPVSITVKYLDYNGKEQLIAAEGLLATCIQHEVDHLNGITIDTHLSHLRRELMLKRLTKRKKISKL